MGNDDYPKLTKDQRETYRLFHEIAMAWVALVVAILLFLGTTVVYLLLLFRPTIDASAKLVTGGIDLILGWCLRQVYGHLFPSGKQENKGK